MKLRMTFRDPWIAVWSAVSILLIVACTALGIGLFATSHANGVAKCVNDILGTRSAPTARDNDAHIAYADAQLEYDRVDRSWHSALTVTLAASKAKQPALYAHFLRIDAQLNAAGAARESANVAYKKQLAADQVDRAAHPLGRCA